MQKCLKSIVVCSRKKLSSFWLVCIGHLTWPSFVLKNIFHNVYIKRPTLFWRCWKGRCYFMFCIYWRIKAVDMKEHCIGLFVLRGGQGGIHRKFCWSQVIYWHILSELQCHTSAALTRDLKESDWTFWFKKKKMPL